jgi:hypothetical protein
LSFVGQETGGRSTVEPGQAGWRRDAGTSVNDGPFCLSVTVRLSRLAIGGDARLTVIIDFIILTVNLVNPAIASLYFRPSQKNSTRWSTAARLGFARHTNRGAARWGKSHNRQRQHCSRFSISLSQRSRSSRSRLPLNKRPLHNNSSSRSKLWRQVYGR